MSIDQEDQRITLRHSAWFGDEDLHLSFPHDWPIRVHGPADQRPLTDDEIVAELGGIVGASATRHRAIGGKLAIVCDDLTRPTPTDRLIPILLRMLQQESVPLKDLTIVTGGGTHAPMSSADMERKFGKDVIRNCEVVPHNANHNLVRLGRTNSGTPIHINQTVYAASVRIGVGGIYPHALAGFGGGAKLTLGVCGFKTIANLHYRIPGSQLGGDTDNPFRRELKDISDRLDFDGYAAVVVNERRQISKIFAGEMSEAHARATAYSRSVFAVPPPGDADVVIANTYPFDSMFHFSKKGWWPTKLASDDAVCVVVGGYPAGRGYHGLHPFGLGALAKIRHKVFVLSQLPAAAVVDRFREGLKSRFSRSGVDRAARPPKIFFRSTATGIDVGRITESNWDLVLQDIRNRVERQQPRVAVYPCAPLLFPANNLQEG